MTEDQSVVGRRRIYYDQHGSETLICSDSEEEIAEPEEDKHHYSEGEDRIIWYVTFLFFYHIQTSWPFSVDLWLLNGTS